MSTLAEPTPVEQRPEAAPAAAPPAGRRALAQVLDRAGMAALLAFPGVLTVWLAFHAGGYFAGDSGLAAVVVLGLVAVRVIGARGALPGIGAAAVVLVGLFGGYVAWTAASGDWSVAPARTAVDYGRVLLYLGVLVLFASIPYTPERLRWILRGLAAAAFVVCLAGALTQLLPGTFPIDEFNRSDRLRYPVSFWNSMGLMGALGGILLGHVACDPRERPAARVLATAALPVCALVIVMTASRGAIATVAFGVVVYAALARPRLAWTTAAAALPAAALAATAAWGEDLSPGGSADGARLLAACVAGAGVLRALLLPLDTRLLRLRLPGHRGRHAAIAVAVAAAAGLAGAAVVVDVPRRASDAWDRFNTDEVLGNGGGRVTSLTSNGRVDLWNVAFDQHATAPWKGTGSGTFGLYWAQRLDGTGRAYDAHSLYFETLGELGWVGLLLLGGFLLAGLAAALSRARGPQRAVGAAAAAAMAAWALAVLVDWHWEIPAVTAWLFAVAGATGATAWRAGGARVPAALRVAAGAAAVALCALLAAAPLELNRSQASLNRAVRAFEDGRCAGANAHAADAARAMRIRSQPFEVIAYCEARLGRLGSALAAIERAIERDPLDARLHINAGLIEAAAGRDPRERLRAARRLAPFELAARDLLDRLEVTPRREWREVGRTTPLVLE